MAESNDVSLQLKLGEIEFLEAFREIGTEMVRVRLLQARDRFLKASGDNMPDQTKRWTQAHLGATYRYLADVVSDSQERNSHITNALQALLSALDLESGQSPTESDVPYPWAFVQLGDTLTYQGILTNTTQQEAERYFKHAIEAFDQAIKLDSQNIRAYAHRGRAYRQRYVYLGEKRQDLESALKDFKSAYDMDNQYYWVVLNLIAVHRELGMLESQHDLSVANEHLRLALLYVSYVTVRAPFIFTQMSQLDIQSMDNPLPPKEDMGSRGQLIRALHESGPTEDVIQQYNDYFDNLANRI